MDFLSPDMLVILFFVAGFAGCIDAMAGGGGLITVPALLATGITPTQALATNKLQGTAGSLTASLYFIRRGVVSLKDMRFAILCTFIGSALGTVLVQQVDTSVLSSLIPLLLIGIALYFLFSKNMDEGEQKITLHTFALTAGFGIGFYDGFFGPGTGSFFAMAFVSLMGFALPKATAHTKVLNCTSNVASLLFFALGGQMVWMLGGVMMLGQFIGARIGARLVLTKGQQLIRPMIVVVSVVMSARLIWQNYFGG
ncbi:TSUP family transporter [Parendozoicomonas haliclonae]|uniref:Probable membrane transporter protein n=1 Tax=Parendozoicomonas haliclonae TaxID=1960125 RepID=A0A1X7AN95_9GAMM|nr:TSUP family transporter [Parendozoicomonas haliclonae]SMA49791.1 hypothetical protein EHSB41UT_03580 [Parendozoicomonas haliclonae]